MSRQDTVGNSRGCATLTHVVLVQFLVFFECPAGNMMTKIVLAEYWFVIKIGNSKLFCG